MRATVLADLERHGLTIGPEDTPSSLRERLNQLYLDDVRRLKARQQEGEIPLRDYARHVTALRESYPLLGLPLTLWLE